MSDVHVSRYGEKAESLKSKISSCVLELVMTMYVEMRNALTVVAVSVIAYNVIKLLWNGVWEPLRLRRIMAKQGVKGPPFRFLFGQVLEAQAFRNSFPENLPLGNYADLSPTVTPQYALFFPKYGRNFVYWLGTSTRIAVRDPEIAKEVYVNNHASLTRSKLEASVISQVLGTGLLSHVGDKWAIERRTLNPFFHQDALKGMVEAMVEGTATGVQKWQQTAAQAGGTAEIDLEPDLHKISGKILSHTAFGGEYEKGEQIYELQMEIAKELRHSYRNPAFWIMPGYRKIPTKRNRYMDQCTAKINALLHEAINGRREAVRKGETTTHGNDLLGRMLTAATEGWDENSIEFNLASVFNNCKLIYFAGQDTVTNTSAFAMLMLAVHPEWQERARKEVMEVLGDEENLNASALSHLKVVGMILNETLRIFAPVMTLARETTKDLQLKSLFVPKGMVVDIAIGAMHQDRGYWGEDVGEFNPERFANGVSGACSHPQAFAPFGLGPKFCMGNSFALMELKVILAMVLRRFVLLPSPNYKHHPTIALGQRPKFGMLIILKAVR